MPKLPKDGSRVRMKAFKLRVPIDLLGRLEILSQRHLLQVSELMRTFINEGVHRQLIRDSRTGFEAEMKGPLERRKPKSPEDEDTFFDFR